MTKAECEKILLGAGFVQFDGGGFWYQSGPYFLKRGEFARPRYYVRPHGDSGWGIMVKYFYIPRIDAPLPRFLTSVELYSFAIRGAE